MNHIKVALRGICVFVDEVVHTHLYDIHTLTKATPSWSHK